MISTAGTRILIGAPHPVDRIAGMAIHGNAYVFDLATGEMEFRFQSSLLGTNFGCSVAMAGNNVLVGESYIATAYLFDGSTGALLRTMNDPRSAIQGYFGAAVAAAGGRIAVGAARDDSATTGAGAVVLYDGPACPTPTPVPAPAGICGADFKRRNPWALSDEHFGSAVAWMGTDILVGVSHDQGIGWVPGTGTASGAPGPKGNKHLGRGAVHLLDGSNGRRQVGR